MSFVLRCPHCNVPVEMEDEWVGLDSQCPSCGKDIHVVKPVEKAAVKKAAPRKKMSPLSLVLLLVLLLLVVGGGFSAWFFWDDIDESMGWKEERERIARERADEEARIRREEEARRNQRQAALAAAEQAAEASMAAERQLEVTTAAGINSSMSRGVREQNKAVADAVAANDRAARAAAEEESRMAAAESAWNDAVAESSRLQQRAAQGIHYPCNPALRTRLMWLDSPAVCGESLAPLADAGNGLYSCKVDGRNMFLKFAEDKLVAFGYVCNANDFDIICSGFNSELDTAGVHDGQWVMRWTVPANNSIIIAEHISFADIEQYAIWCVYDKYYPWLSQTRIDNVIDAVAGKADNFVNARQCIDTAMASYPFAFAIENVRELNRGLVAAEKDFYDQVQRSVVGSAVQRARTEEMLERVFGKYSYPSVSTPFSFR